MSTKIFAFRKDFPIRSISVILMLLLLPFFLSFGSTPTANAAGDISGTVYRDYNANGTMDSGESGIAGITVTAYDAAGSQQGTATTIADGTYVLNATGTGPYRIEFTGWPTYLHPGAIGPQSASSVQFVPDGNSANIDMGLNNPADYYSNSNPLISLPTYRNGLAAGQTALGIGSFAYNSTGLNSDFNAYDASPGTGPTPNQDADVEEVGSVWGMSWQSEQQRLFAGAFLKRHVSFADGPGFVYVLDYTTTPATVATQFDLQGVAPANGGANIDLGSVCRRSATDGAGAACDPQATGLATDYLLSTPVGESIDLDAFGKVGTISYGDLDLQEDAPNLWLVNLNQKALISVDVSGASGSLPGAVNQYPLASLSGWPSASCSAAVGELRPWALQFNDGKGYVGVVCDASVSQSDADLHAYVLSFDPNNVAAGLSSELDFALNYTRGNAANARWDFHYWIDQWIAPPIQINGNNAQYPQPVLSDIEFDANGNMYLNLFDRFGHQYGFFNRLPISNTASTMYRADTGGDILKVCSVGGAWELAGDTNCPFGFTSNNAGPLGAGEFFEDVSGDTKIESTEGALAILKGNGQIITNAVDPHPTASSGPTYYHTQGVNTFNLNTGAIDNWYAILFGSNLPFFGKSHGIGDIEFLTESTPLEVGNRLWWDENGDGIQDPGEPNVAAGVNVVMTCGVEFATVQTDANGNYLFTDAIWAAAATTTSTRIPRQTSCTIRVNPADVGGVPTRANASSGLGDGNDDIRDSDGLPVGVNVEVTFTTGRSGENNHTYDFGFFQPVSIGSYVWLDDNGDGFQGSTELGVPGALVELLVDDGTGTFVAATDVTGTAVSTQTTLANGLYHFTNLPPGNYRVRVTPPAVYVPTTIQTTADNDDSPNDSNIAREATVGTYESGTFTLHMNGEPTEAGGYDGDDQDDGSNETDGNMTVDFGFVQPVAIGNVVWIDDGAGGGTELNGIMDGTEQGVPDVIVELYRAGDTPGVDTPFLTTVTDANGEYLFDMIPQGDYIVHIPASEFVYGEPLSSFISSTGNGGDNTIDDDGDENGVDNADPAANGISSTVISVNVGVEPTGETGQGSYSGTLIDASVNMTVDFGFFELLTLGNYIWFDLDEDGIIDSDEPPVPGVVVYLLDGNGNPMLNPITGQPISTVTDSNGFYQFTHLLPGEYQVLVGAENFQPGGALEGYFSSFGAVDPDDNSDIDDNGVDAPEPWVTGVMSAPIRLDYNAEPDNFEDTDDDDNTNLTVDLGFVIGPDVPTAVTLISFTASNIGNQQVRINWVTGSETDNFGFRLYRGNSSSFAGASQIYFEAAAISGGGDAPGASYSFVDDVPSNGTYYYWLEDVDTGGDTALHGPISVEVTPFFTTFLPIVVGGN